MSDINWKDILIGKEGAFGAGLGNSVTMGFRDEALGGLLGFKDFAANYLKNGYPSEGLAESYKNYYIKNRDDQRAMDQQLQLGSPIAYGAGNIAGSAALPGSTIPGLIGMGAVSGVGNSESDTVSGNVGSGLVGGAVGGVAGGLAAGAGKAVQGIRGAPAGEISEIGTGPGELVLHADPIDMGVTAAKGNPVMDRVAAFRARQAAGENVAYKSDKIAKEMFGLDPVEGGYNPYVDDITVPIDKRGNFGIPSGAPPIDKSINPYDQVEKYRMLIGERSMPAPSRVPQLGEFYNMLPNQSVNTTQLGAMVPESAPVNSIQLGGYPVARAVTAVINDDED